MRFRKNPMVAYLIAFWTITSIVAAQTPAQDEAYVRGFYNRVHFLSQLRGVNAAAIRTSAKFTSRELENQAELSTVQFSLDSMSTGRVADIRNDHWTQYVTPDVTLPRVLRLILVTTNYRDSDSNASMCDIEATWQAPNPENADALDALNGLSVGKMLDLGGKAFMGQQVDYTEYVSYTVMSTFQGKTQNAPYHALALFGKNLQGERVISFQDPGNPGTAGLNVQVLDQPENTYPVGLLKTHLRDSSIVVEWLSRHSVATSACLNASEPGKDLCCTETICGLSRDALRQELQSPVLKTITVSESH